LLFFAEIVKRALAQLGHYPNLLQISDHGFGETGAALVNSGVDKVLITKQEQHNIKKKKNKGGGKI
jgi:hypothetical protein